MSWFIIRIVLIFFSGSLPPSFCLSLSPSSCASLSLSLFVYLCLYDSPYLSISLSVSLAPPFPLSPYLFIIYLFLCFLSLLPSLSLFLSFFSLSVSHSFHPLDVVSQTKIFIATIAPIKCNTLCTLLHFAERPHDQIFAPSWSTVLYCMHFTLLSFDLIWFDLFWSKLIVARLVWYDVTWSDLI